ncbi:hypothetical protein DSL72_004151 [Monilinia vaccinii-corymbosi]|uniref:Small ribosomal subunit protein mS38 n=1 Tax=Monilinia vaccinii-corymbosi TaxID=61207 RepID=A0A8A3NVA1_9HELO|nr:hypothetical protein DSL72_004151 [Monilinia vaccinii-corymbosi]
MFFSSFRRAVLTRPPLPIILPIHNVAPRAAASQALSIRCNQRRLSSSSSSKPSSPADGPKEVADGQAVPATPTQARPDGEKKASKAGRRKAKDGPTGSANKGDTMHNLPSVPSTSHISPSQIAVSAFFSLHRPICLTMNFPKAASGETFASLSTPRARSNKSQDVIATLSNTLQSLDSATGSLQKLNIQDEWNEERDDLRAGITADSYRVQQLDIIEPPRSVLVRRYTPFSPPPVPVPMSTEESLSAGAKAAAEHEEAHLPQQRTYHTVLTINESTDANGEVTYTAESGPIVSEDPPRSYIERRRIYRRERATMWAISVKRQRKLKMKKHKYKKLMRRTRNLRRRLDRN